MRVFLIFLLCAVCTGCTLPGGVGAEADEFGSSLFLNAVFSSGYMLAHVGLGIVAAFLIYRDAVRLPRLFLGTKPWWWAVAAVFLGPVWVVLVYWVIHHSSISNRFDERDGKGL